MRTGDSNLGVEYTQVLFNQAAPLGADGKPRKLSSLSRQEVAALPVQGWMRDADDRTVGIDVNRGHRVLVSMFYGSCAMGCPEGRIGMGRPAWSRKLPEGSMPRCR